MEEIINQLHEHFQLPLESPVLIFSLILFIILLAPIILNRIKIPGIIGLIISGIIIGPDGLNVLENNEFVDIFSTIGLLYIMFIAGLELDINQFKANKNKSLLFGFFTFIIPLSIGFPVCYYLLSIGDDSFTMETALLTASMFSTHTLVTYPIVNKLGVAKNTAVAITVGATMLTDTVVLILLAVILGSQDGGLTQDFWIGLGVAIILLSAFMFLIIPKIAKWFFEKFSSEKHSHYIFVLAVVFLAAFLADIAGLEDIIGAFFAGLALNKLIPTSSTLMNRIQFIGNSLFIPFFLISVGMVVDVSVIFSGWMALIIAGTLTLVAVCGKWLAAWITQLVFKFSKPQRNLIFGLSSAHAAATLAIILVGHDAGIIDDNILNGTIILILITSIIASFATERAGKKIAQNKEDELDEEKSNNSESILIPISNTVNIEKMLDFSVFVKDNKSEVPLLILTVVPNNVEAEKKIIQAKKSLKKFVEEMEASETSVDVKAAIDHNVASGISRTAREYMADLIFLGWPQRTGFIEKLIGNKMNSIISLTEKTLFICDFKNPLINHERLFILAPPQAELEEGFSIWLDKVVQLAQELSLPVYLNCNDETHEATQDYFSSAKLNLTINHNNFTDWSNFLSLSDKIKDSDLFIMVSARNSYVSHFNHLDRIPGDLERHFKDLTKMIIYPQ